MGTIQMNFPDGVAISDMDVVMFIAAKLYEDGTLSPGEAAVLTGLSPRTFIELLGKYGVSVYNHSPDDLKSDIASA